MISKKCQNPKAAIKLLTYLLSEEGQKMTWLGTQGEMWDYNKDGVPEIKDDVRKLLYTDRKKYNSIYGGDSCYWMMQNDAMASQWIKDDPDNPVTQLKNRSYPYTTYVGQYTIVFDTSTDVGKIKNKAEKKIGVDVLPLLLLSKSDREFDKIITTI